ncbi:K(+) efflux antiporter 6-like isoform X1 [Olea europaea var. sylvestris]|uniref:K(+) efflux antiporter 6-like isoform X1 n=1 Tax=Olea europaea var. sylvestris TaxID=158386 RepID=UPI000C1D0922|nr:K(+) efflux antiporter 6-like isoform X1 [Olea europaea var. sylvestris]
MTQVSFWLYDISQSIKSKYAMPLFKAVLETVAGVKPKKNETKTSEEKSFKLHHVFKLDNDNGAEETPTLIDRKVKMELRSVHLGPCEWCGGRTSEGVFVGAFLSMSSTAVVYEFLMEKNGTNALHGQVTIGTLILQVVQGLCRMRILSMVMSKFMYPWHA